MDCQGLLCKQGQSRGASNVCVGHFLAAWCLFLCRDAFAAAFAQELDAFYVGSPGAITEGQTIFKMDFIFERWKQSIQRGQMMDYPEKWFTMVGCGGRRESLELE